MPNRAQKVNISVGFIQLFYIFFVQKDGTLNQYNIKTMKTAKILFLIVLLATSISYKIPNSNYDSDIAHALSIYSFAAYNSQLHLHNWSCHLCYFNRLIDRATFKDQKTGVIGVMGYTFSGDGNVVTISWNDQNSLKDTLDSAEEYRQIDYPKCKNCKVNQKIYNAFLSVKSQITANLKQLWKKNPKFITAIYFTGHSLGGAIATLAALEEQQNYPNDIKIVYSFGKPRIGNKQFAEWCNSKLQAFRIIFNNDPAPSLPPKSSTSPLQIQNSLLLNKQIKTLDQQRHQLQVHNQETIVFDYLHEGSEVWFKRDRLNEPIICVGDSIVKQCYNGLKNYQIQDHSKESYLLTPNVVTRYDKHGMI